MNDDRSSNDDRDAEDREVFAVLESAREQYEAYLAVQDSLSSILSDEPEAPMPSWDHPLGLVICE